MNTIEFIFRKDCPCENIISMMNDVLAKYNFAVKKEDIRFIDESPLSDSTLDATERFILGMQVNVCIPFTVVLSVEETPNLVSARKKFDGLRARLDKFNKESLISNYKYEYYGCPCCGSRLNVKYIPDDCICPLCHKELRKASVLEKLKDLEDKLYTANMSLHEQYKKNIEQGKFTGTQKLLVILFVDFDVDVNDMDVDFSGEDPISVSVDATKEDLGDKNPVLDHSEHVDEVDISVDKDDSVEKDELPIEFVYDDKVDNDEENK